MGLFSTMSGMPNIHADNVMKRTEGRQRFSSLPNILKSEGYKTFFAVSHVPHFDNMGGFMSMNGTDKIISENDFDKSEVLSSLGVPDHRLFEEMNNTFRTSNTPFFATILSSNNHGPWIIPEVKGKRFDNTFLYTDWALEHFFDLASKEEYFDNTIFIITADHGIPEDAIYDFDLSATHVPMIFYSPKHIASSRRNNIMSHIDLTETILGLLEIPHKTSSFSRNILSLPESENGFALVQEGMKIGLIYNDWYIIDRLGSNPSLYKYKSKTPTYDYSKDSTQIVKDLRHKLHSLYFLSNEMIFEMQASVSNY
jgi:phosphoglycerol transferase MdoB-like AlkP superfamily enzyme